MLNGAPPREPAKRWYTTRLASATAFACLGSLAGAHYNYWGRKQEQISSWCTGCSAARFCVSALLLLFRLCGFARHRPFNDETQDFAALQPIHQPGKRSSTSHRSQVAQEATRTASATRRTAPQVKGVGAVEMLSMLAPGCTPNTAAGA